MLIEQDRCTACANCLPYCPVGAIKAGGDMVAINQEECVECGVCFRIGVCDLHAIKKPELTWPRIIRAHYSDPTAGHPETILMGRGTSEMKTNDVTGRFRCGEAGFGVELGRPNTGTSMRDVEKVAQALAALGVQWETRGNPTCYLMADPATGKLKEEVLNEKVLSAILEFKVPAERLAEVLAALEQVAGAVDTVFSVSMITKVEKDGALPNVAEAQKLGYTVGINPKVNLGLGRPLFDFGARGEAK